MIAIKWKVCGLRDNISDVVALQPDYVGFIFYSKSPRFVGEKFTMPEFSNENVKKVGVFVNESLEYVLDTTQKYQLDYVQLHGDETPAYCVEISNRKVGIIKAFLIDATFDFDTLKSYDATVDYFLFDTRSKKYGGSGTTFDWKILNKYSLDKKYFLSGGISLDNIEELQDINRNKIHAIDVNSKFEISSGCKDIAMLKILDKKLVALNQG